MNKQGNALLQSYWQTKMYDSTKLCITLIYNIMGVIPKVTWLLVHAVDLQFDNFLAVAKRGPAVGAPAVQTTFFFRLKYVLK